jgi:DNA-binding XRE family transcriptional regulator
MLFILLDAFFTERKLHTVFQQHIPMIMNSFFIRQQDHSVTVGENIRRWRLLRGIKQNMLADRLGVTAATMSHIENNKHDITLRRLQEIARLIGVTVSQLLEDPENFLDLEKVARHTNLTG